MYCKHVWPCVCVCVFCLILCMAGNVLWRAVAVSVISTGVYRGSLSRSGPESEWFCSSARALLHLDCGVDVTGLPGAWGICRKWIQQKEIGLRHKARVEGTWWKCFSYVTSCVWGKRFTWGEGGGGGHNCNEPCTQCGRNHTSRCKKPVRGYRCLFEPPSSTHQYNISPITVEYVYDLSTHCVYLKPGANGLGSAPLFLVRKSLLRRTAQQFTAL